MHRIWIFLASFMLAGGYAAQCVGDAVYSAQMEPVRRFFRLVADNDATVACDQVDQTRPSICHTAYPGDQTFSGTVDDSAVTGNILSNDTHAEDDTHTATLVTPPYTGTPNLSSNESFTYTAASNFNGAVPFEYRVSDGFLTDIGVATISTSSVDDAPVAVADSFTGTVGDDVTGNVLSNDSGSVEDHPLTATVVGSASTGSVVLDGSGQFTYTPPSPSFTGTATFTYQASDGTLTSKAVATIDYGGSGSGNTPDFVARASSPGVIFSQGFDTGTVIPRSSKTTEGEFVGSCSGPTCVHPVVEDGHLHFTILSGGGAGAAGQYYVQFADLLGHGIGLGQNLYIQWRQYLPATLLDTSFLAKGGGHTANKLIIVSGNGTSSCDKGHFVITKYPWTKDTIPIEHGNFAMYNNCGPYENIEQQNVPGGKLFDSQPVLSDVTGKTAEMVAAHVFNARSPSVNRQCWRNHRTNCLVTPSDQWVTLQLSLEFGTSTYLTGTVTRVPVHVKLTQDGVTMIDTVKGSRGWNVPRGRVWFLPYMTGKDPAQVHPNTYTDIDEVIISTQPIPDPR
jgi:hypothetical protein